MTDADSMRQAMMGVTEMFEPFGEWGIGYKNTLITQGWSEPAAETIALEGVLFMMRKAMNS